jgi:phage baseplate assembly protein W
MSERKRVLGTDLRLKESEQGADLALAPNGDLATVSNEYNLAQAIVARLRIRRGELRDIGHNRLGSRLYDFVGEPNNEATRERIRNAVRETLREEPRISQVINVNVKTSDEDRDRVDVKITIVPIGQEVPLNIVMPFYLEVA